MLIAVRLVSILLATQLFTACGPKQTEPAPKYKPVNSPEAKTACPTEWKAAKRAREIVLEESNQATQKQAAAAVFRHAECERAQFDKSRLPGPNHDQLLGQIRAARGLYNTTHNLYKEVPNYQSAPEAIKAHIRLGELHRKFAYKLRTIRTPRDMTSMQERGAFLSQLSTLAAGFDRSAARAFAAGVRRAEKTYSTVPAAADMRTYLATACEALKILAADAPQRATCSALLP